MAQLLIEKGIFTGEEFHSKLSQVAQEYRDKQKGKMASFKMAKEGDYR
jgi:hypothetical protein